MIHNENIELHIYKKLEELGDSSCKNILEFEKQTNQIYRNPTAYRHYECVIWFVRFLYRAKTGVKLNGRKPYTKTQAEELLRIIDKIMEV